MKAIRYRQFGELPELTELPQPACPPDGVLIDVRATGVCRSDWHAWKGHDPVELPHVPGHEFAGVVAEVGPAVRDWRSGDRVTAPFVLGCGKCEFCRSGDGQVCPDQRQPGFTGPGSFADQVAIGRADFNLVGLPESVDFRTAASLGCRFATAFRALTVHGRLQPGQWLAVHGCGGVGLSAVMIAVALGARVIAVDVSAAALVRAAALGAEHTVLASRTVDPTGSDLGFLNATGDPADAVQQLTGGAHVSVDAIGHPATAAASVRSLRRRGRHVQIGLLLGTAAQTTLPMDLIVSRELEVYGSHGMAARDYPALLALVVSGALRPSELISRVLPLADGGRALAAMDGDTAPGMTVLELP